MDESRLAELSDRLRSVELKLKREMQLRGFDPAQLENTALPTSLAKLLAERDEIKADLKEAEGSSNTEPEERMYERTEED